MFFAGSLTAVFWCLMLFNTAVTVAVKSLTKPMWLMISGLSVLVLLATYAAVHQGAALSIASLQLNIPMAIYVAWSLYRATALFKRAENVRAYNVSGGISEVNQDDRNQEARRTSVNA